MIPHKTISNNFENGQKQASKYSRSRPLRVFRLVKKIFIKIHEETTTRAL